MIRIHKKYLPSNEQNIYDELYSYFLDHDINIVESDGDYWLISLSKKIFNYCDDIKVGLDWLNLSESNSVDFYLQGDNYLFCLAESFIPYGWSCLYSKTRLDKNNTVLLHLDSHRDLMDTRLSEVVTGIWKDLLTNKQVKFSEPQSVLASIQSGAIGIGSMVTPLLHDNPHINIAHYNPSVNGKKLFHVKPDFLNEHLFECQENLLCSSITNPTNKQKSNYIESNSLHEVVKFSKDKDNILLHIDMDSLNNRYNGDSDWESEGAYYDNDIFSQVSDIENLISLIIKYNLAKKIRHTSIGISPSFYPVEFWNPVTQYLLSSLIKCGIDLSELYNRLYSQKTYCDDILNTPPNLHLEITNCNTFKKQRWNIYYNRIKAGKVTIVHNRERASINVQLNKSHQGLGIGKYIFHLACDNSHHDIIEAVMRKNNLASMHSALKAGFFELETKEKRSQRHMVWLRK
ncbi:MAG: hypothetical protein KIC48_12575 [Citrobacter sp.]|uniref:hypothetical protein n=1 Tax=unclassified Citrobacter TaxID=2644389 RepID=UPI001900F1D1|nr:MULTISPECIES: hypothetical protein [unclassified Citrobacter]MBJ9110489.1 hypothetical protein [Citrobacter sp. FDAARGOS_156]MBS6003331.1 hypothetical protein [Citrobacter sp.]